MYLGRVIGTVVSTTKDESLVGFKLLVVSKGSSARYVLNKPNSPIDSAVVGIVDSVEVDDV